MYKHLHTPQDFDVCQHICTSLGYVIINVPFLVGVLLLRKGTQIMQCKRTMFKILPDRFFAIVWVCGVLHSARNISYP